MRLLLLLLTFSALLCVFGDAKRLGTQPLPRSDALALRRAGAGRVAVGGSTGGMFTLQPVFVPVRDGIQIYGSDLPITAADVKQLLEIKMAAGNKIVVLSGSHGGEHKSKGRLGKGHDPMYALAFGNIERAKSYFEPKFFQEDQQTMSELFMQLQKTETSWFKRVTNALDWTSPNGARVEIIDIADWLDDFEGTYHNNKVDAIRAMVDFIDDKVNAIKPDVLIMGWCHGSQSPIIDGLAKKHGWVATGAVGTNAGLHQN